MFSASHLEENEVVIFFELTLCYCFSAEDGQLHGKYTDTAVSARGRNATHVGEERRDRDDTSTAAATNLRSSWGEVKKRTTPVPVVRFFQCIVKLRCCFLGHCPKTAVDGGCSNLD